jgi:hypothetical protein
MIVDFHTHIIAPDEHAGFTDSKFLDRVLEGTGHRSGQAARCSMTTLTTKR